MVPNRAALLAEAESLLRSVPFTKEISSKIDSLLQLADRTVDHSELRRATLQARDRELGRTSVAVHEPSSADFEFRCYLGADQTTARDLAQASQKRAQTTTTTAGGYLVPQSFSDRFETILAQYDGIFDAASLFSTRTGSATGFPIVDDVGSSAQIVAEGVTSNSGDVTFATLAFSACPTWRSDMVAASVELIADAAFSIENLLARAFARRFAAGVGSSFMTALLSQATLGKTTASATAIVGDELFDLVDSLDPMYSANGAWLMQRATLTYIYKLKGSTSGDYLFKPDRDANGRPMLIGFPVFLSPGAGPMTSEGKSVLFGDLSRFIRRQVRNSFEVKSYPERNAEYGENTFQGFLRVQGGLA